MLDSQCSIDEIIEIKSKIINGKLYDDLEQFFNFEIENNKFKRNFFDVNCGKIRTFYFDTKRDVVKRLVLFFLYKSNNTKHDKDYKKFQEIYPNFCKVLEMLKEEDNKKLPKVLQHLEADCIIDYTCKEIAKEFPNVPLFTIHDSIITTSPNFDLVNSKVKKYITNYCDGLTPVLKKDDWSN